MTTYSIKDLEKLSGIKAHTVRIWEQRYQLFVPERSDTNIRSYSDEQVKKLLNIATLISAGFKISKISQMSNSEIADQLDDIYGDGPERKDDYIPEVNALVSAALDYDQGAITQKLNEAIGKLGFEETFEKILYPVLRKVGQLWRKDKLSPSQEHFLSCLIKQKLYGRIESLEYRKTDKKTFLLFLPDWEDHEIGLIYGHYLLRRLGFNVIYLGSKVPARNLVGTVNSLKPDYMMTFMIGKVFPHVMDRYFKELSEGCDAHLLISGNQRLINQINADLKIKLFTSIGEFKDFVTFV